MVVEPDKLTPGEVPDQPEKRGSARHDPTAQLRVVQTFGLLQHACACEIEERQGGVELAAVIAGYRLSLRLELGHRLILASAANPPQYSFRAVSVERQWPFASSAFSASVLDVGTSS